MSVSMADSSTVASFMLRVTKALATSERAPTCALAVAAADCADVTCPWRLVTCAFAAVTCDCKELIVEVSCPV